MERLVSRPPQSIPVLPARRSPRPTHTAMSLVAPVVAVVVAVALQFPGDADPTGAQKALAPSTERWKGKKNNVRIRLWFFVVVYFFLLKIREANKEQEKLPLLFNRFVSKSPQFHGHQFFLWPYRRFLVTRLGNNTKPIGLGKAKEIGPLGSSDRRHVWSSREQPHRLFNLCRDNTKWEYFS